MHQGEKALELYVVSISHVENLVNELYLFRPYERVVFEILDSIDLSFEHGLAQPVNKDLVLFFRPTNLLPKFVGEVSLELVGDFVLVLLLCAILLKLFTSFFSKEQKVLKREAAILVGIHSK